MTITTNYQFSLITKYYFQKLEKPKFVTCLTFSGEGDVISGDSNGNIHVWLKGWDFFLNLKFTIFLLNTIYNLLSNY